VKPVEARRCGRFANFMFILPSLSHTISSTSTIARLAK
jgi:hypothetical protein